MTQNLIRATLFPGRGPVGINLIGDPADGQFLTKLSSGPRDFAGASALPAGSLIDAVTQDVDKAPSGRAVSASVPQISLKGALTPASTGLATLTSALAAAGQGGSLDIDADLDLGTATPPTNPGASLSTQRSIFSRPAGAGSTIASQGRTVYNLYDTDRDVWGVPNIMPRIRARWEAGLPVALGVAGDSNSTEPYPLGTTRDALLRSLPNTTVTDFAIAGTYMDQWLNHATGPYAGTGKDIDTVLAANLDGLILSFGTNDPTFGRDLDAWETTADATFAKIRGSANGSVQRLSLIYLTPSAMGDGTVNAGTDEMRDQVWSRKLRAAIVRQCLKWNVMFVDQAAFCSDTSLDYAPGPATDSVFDPYRVHAQKPAAEEIDWQVFRVIAPPSMAYTMTLNPPGDTFAPAITDPPSLYRRGFSTSRAVQWHLGDGTAIMVDGYVDTSFPADGTAPRQVLWAYNSNERYVRVYDQIGDLWRPFETEAEIDLSVHNFAAADLLTAWPRGQASARATSGQGYPLDGWVRNWRETSGGAQGWQELMAYSADVPVQRRQYTTAGWGVWR